MSDVDACCKLSCDYICHRKDEHIKGWPCFSNNGSSFINSEGALIVHSKGLGEREHVGGQHSKRAHELHQVLTNEPNDLSRNISVSL